MREFMTTSSERLIRTDSVSGSSGNGAFVGAACPHEVASRYEVGVPFGGCPKREGADVRDPLREEDAGEDACIHMSEMRSALQARIDEGMTVAMSAMKSLGETHVLIGFLKNLSKCETPTDVMKECVSSIRDGFSASCEMSLSEKDEVVFVSSESVSRVHPKMRMMERLLSKERIISCRESFIVNYGRLSLRVHLKDVGEDAVERVRDVAVQMCESADERLTYLCRLSRAKKTEEVSKDIIRSLLESSKVLKGRWKEERRDFEVRLENVLSDMKRFAETLCLSENMRGLLVDTVSDGLFYTLSSFDGSESFGDRVEEMVESISKLSEGA